jgi:dipeptidase E
MEKIMLKRNLLLLSNSTTQGYGYLEHAVDMFKKFFDKEEILFIPYAGVSFSFDEYYEKVKKYFNSIGLEIKSIHNEVNPRKAVENADAIAVGGGNTFHLLSHIYCNDLRDAIRDRVHNGAKYTGWSAGSNLACPTIKTTNDMPIIMPRTFDALNLIPFQINPHYTDQTLQGHFGESREQRLIEYLHANPDKIVLGLREGTALEIHDNDIKLIGDKKAVLFELNKENKEFDTSDSLEFLL